jgi:hypothetical protein
MDTWVPGDACTLPTAEQPLRVAEFDDLFTQSLRHVDRTAPTRLRLTLRRYPGATDTVEDLVSRETECCSFFVFAVRSRRGAILLDISVPEPRMHVLDGLERRARNILAAHAR